MRFGPSNSRCLWLVKGFLRWNIGDWTLTCILAQPRFRLHGLQTLSGQTAGRACHRTYGLSVEVLIETLSPLLDRVCKDTRLLRVYRAAFGSLAAVILGLASATHDSWHRHLLLSYVVKLLLVSVAIQLWWCLGEGSRHSDLLFGKLIIRAFLRLKQAKI